VLQTANVRANDNMHRSDSQASARLWKDHLQLVATGGYLDQLVPAATPSNPGLTVHSITTPSDAPPRTSAPASLPAQPRTFAPCDVVVDKQTELGRGPCGVVYAGTLNEHTEVAVKVIRVGHGDTLKKVKDEFRRVNRASHHNVVQVFGIVELPGDETVGIVMERLGVSLQKAKVSDPFTRMRYTLDIIAGMEHIHCVNRSVVHFDLKLSNILVTEGKRPSVKVAVFRVPPTASTMASDSAALISGSLRFMAPEHFAEEWSPSPACDVYSFAVVLAELWTGAVAWEGTATHLIPGEVMEGHSPFSQKDLSERGVPASIIALIVACWAQEPEHRPTFAQLSEIRTIPNFHLAPQEAWPLFLRSASSGLL
jgi:serine/threonine protein kinase